jgi:hypothetical protein
MRAALTVVDVPVQDGRWAVTLRRADPEAVRKAAQALPHAGTARTQGKSVQFEGPPSWLQQLPSLVFGAELTHPQAIPARSRPSGALHLP